MVGLYIACRLIFVNLMSLFGPFGNIFEQKRESRSIMTSPSIAASLLAQRSVIGYTCVLDEIAENLCGTTRPEMSKNVVTGDIKVGGGGLRLDTTKESYHNERDASWRFS